MDYYHRNKTEAWISLGGVVLANMESVEDELDSCKAGDRLKRDKVFDIPHNDTFIFTFEIPLREHSTSW